MGQGDWLKARKKLTKAGRSLSNAIGEVVELMAMDPSSGNKARFDQAYDLIERARRTLGEVRPR